MDSLAHNWREDDQASDAPWAACIGCIKDHKSDIYFGTNRGRECHIIVPHYHFPWKLGVLWCEINSFKHYSKTPINLDYTVMTRPKLSVRDTCMPLYLIFTDRSYVSVWWQLDLWVAACATAWSSSPMASSLPCFWIMFANDRTRPAGPTIHGTFSIHKSHINRRRRGVAVTASSQRIWECRGPVLAYCQSFTRMFCSSSPDHLACTFVDVRTSHPVQLL